MSRGCKTLPLAVVAALTVNEGVDDVSGMDDLGLWMLLLLLSMIMMLLQVMVYIVL